MKKILGISSVFVGIGLIVCLICGFLIPVTESVPKNSAFVYKLLTGLSYFIRYLPAMVITGYSVSCAVHFGRNPEGSADRFSPAMAQRYKTVMISTLITCTLLTIATEAFGLLIRQERESIVNQPKLINEYIQVGNNLFDNGYYERAMVYADAALKLNPESRKALQLKDKADVEITRQSSINYRFRLYETANEEADTVNHVSINSQQILEVYNCYLIAKENYEKEQWFNAHYYANLGIGLATAKDPNLKALQQISTSAWNNLSKDHKLAKTQDQKYFDRKYEGYKALVQKDDLKAYYIFKELYETSPDLQRDMDVNFYLEIAENRVKEKYFFIDETLELSSFENANDVYYSYTYKDGSVDIVYFKGVTTVGKTGKAIQYLRNLTILTIDNKGNFLRKMEVPYAKVLPVDVKSINSTTKMLMGISDKADFLPYIMLNSVGRDKPNTEVKPVYTYAPGTKGQNPDYLLLPVKYSDFIMLEGAGADPELISIPNLFKMIKSAESYGFSPVIYGHSLLNRLFYPLVLIILFVLLASFGWNNRIGMNQYFKMSWTLFFPFMFVIASLMYRLFIFIFKILNFVILGCTSTLLAAIIICLGIYLVIFVIVSIYFFGRTSRT